MSDNQTGVVGGLTDGTGVSPLTLTKLVKDFIADFLMTAAAALAAAQIFALPGDAGTWGVAATAIAGAAIRAAYRIVLRWATTP